MEIAASGCAANVEANPPWSLRSSLGLVYGSHNLVYAATTITAAGCDAEPNGDGGYVLALLWASSSENVVGATPDAEATMKASAGRMQQSLAEQ